MTPIATNKLSQLVEKTVANHPVWDLHTHLYPPAFGSPVAGASTGTRDHADPQGLSLWGIDELLTYHYLVAEVFRVVPAQQLAYADYWRMSKPEQADHIWKHLFLERSPLSEACRGVLTTLERLGLDTGDRNLASYRKWFAEQTLDGQIDRVMEIAGVSRITMTNDVFDDNERERWLADDQVGSDPRFAPVLRFDPLLCDWPDAAQKLNAWGYDTKIEIDDKTLKEVRRFLEEWIDRTKAIYCAVSLPPTYRYDGPEDLTPSATIFREAVLPTLEQRDLPMAMMIGVERGVNPALQVAGDTLGKSDVASVIRLCRDFPNNRFLCTMLARENQHELAVAARKFGNLMIFGCWWFLNNPSLIEEITRMRIELLGPTFAPQHSDARVLEQLVYKWDHSRQIIGRVLAEKYTDLADTGWQVTEEEVRRDVNLLLRDNFANFLVK